MAGGSAGLETAYRNAAIMGLMMLAAGPGAAITIKAIGKDSAIAVDTLAKLVSDGFGEED